MLSIFLADTSDAAFGTTTVDGAGAADMGQYSSMAVGTSGAADISVIMIIPGNKALMGATNVSGSWGTTTVDTTGSADVGLWTSIAVGTSGQHTSVIILIVLTTPSCMPRTSPARGGRPQWIIRALLLRDSIPP